MPVSPSEKCPVPGFQGEYFSDELHRRLYATDASVYRELPLAVAIPHSRRDLVALVRYAGENDIPLIPRASGTSLAGQCVGEGLVVDISKSFTGILEVNQAEGWVRVEPGVIRDELNRHLQPFGLFFGPNTSTANRATIGGMVGNNSCGSTSIVYGSTRDHVLELQAILSDGSEVVFGPLSEAALEEKCKRQSLEGQLYRQIRAALSEPERQQLIRAHYPKKEIHRRNTGYAIDLLLEQSPFKAEGPPFNLCSLLCGSEGTLAFVTEIKLALDPLPDPFDLVVAAHFDSVNEALQATLIAMAHRPSACELMDKVILDCTLEHREQQKNRFFLKGDPAAVLMVEFRGNTLEEARGKAGRLVGELKEKGKGYAHPVIEMPESNRVWALRKAGLGLLSNVKGDAKPVACIEDTAVALADLPAYIEEFETLMEGFGQRAVYYAHAGAGELHLRPMLNLKASEDRELFYRISSASAALVKKYRGSLSGEHGDGRVRAPFLPEMVGPENYALLREIKRSWDPKGIFNPGKIVDAGPMTESLRYESGQSTPAYDTLFDFSADGGIVRLAEKCNGSGDCRKLHLAGGTMCPSYHATRNEKDSTRARANALREYLGGNGPQAGFDHPELKEVLDLCLSCKGCTAECPSNVDMAALKAEWQYQYYKNHGPSLRSRTFAHIGHINALAARFPQISNFFLLNPVLSTISKRVLGVAAERSLPSLAKQELLRWWKKRGRQLKPSGAVKQKVLLYPDEFTRYNDVEVGKKAVELLLRLGYRVEIPDVPPSGRPQLSKGFLGQARALAGRNVEALHGKVGPDTPLLGVEPSAILGFRDEFPKLLRGEMQEKAFAVAPHALLIEEFLAAEARKGRIGPEDFGRETRHVLLHGHCHQKALTRLEDAVEVLSLPRNFHVEVIPSGCCGMAGSFGYEKEHFEVSMKVGELVLFPAVRQASPEQLIVASGTSCRHQILDGTGRRAVHAVEAL